MKEDNFFYFSFGRKTWVVETFINRYAYLGYQVGLTSTLIRVSKVVADRNSQKEIIEQYYFRSTFFIIDIFWKLQYLMHFFQCFSKTFPNFCQLTSSFEVVYIREILALNLFIYMYLHCV